MAEEIKKLYKQGICPAIMVKNAAKKGMTTRTLTDTILFKTEVA